MKTTTVLAAALLAALAAPAFADSVTVTINQLSEQGVGKAIGTIKAEDSKDGLVLTTNLKGLAPGDHGFHMHENPSCDAKEKDGKKVAGLAAGGHHDPSKSSKHLGPKGQGHLGDLPKLVAAKDGSTNVRLVAPRLKVADLKGRSLMIHEGGDNYSDDPKPLGGGGGRFACGVVK